MHLLFVSSMLLGDAPASGFEIANAAIVDEYRRQGVRLSFAGFRQPGARMPGPAELPLGSLAIENAVVGRAQKLAWLGRAFATGLPVSAAKLAVLSDDDLARHLAAAGQVDGYVLNSIQMPAAYPFLVKAKPSIFIAHNVEHRSAAENAANARSLAKRLLYRREARLLKIAETRICRDAAVVHTLSREDADALGLGGDPRCRPVALAVGRPALRDSGRRAHDIGMIGTWSWAPNRVGLDWFLEAVVPLLPPDMTVAIAGRFDGRPPRAPGNVAFAGRVADAQAFVSLSRVMALATKGGTGVQLKTIEAFEEGMPAVATPQAVRGIGRLPANVLVTEHPAAFAASLVEMVAAERAGLLGRRNGLDFALAQRHALSASIGAGIDALEAALSRPARSRRQAEPDHEQVADPMLAHGTAGS